LVHGKCDLDVAAARDEGVQHSFLQPAGKPVPMVATKDVGSAAAALLLEDWHGTRVVELEGLARVSPNDLAQTFAAVLGRAVRVESVPRESWEPLFRAQGARNPLPRIRMLDGFNESWIEFQDQGRSAMKGTTALETVIAQLVEAAKTSVSGRHNSQKGTRHGDHHHAMASRCPGSASAHSACPVPPPIRPSVSRRTPVIVFVFQKVSKLQRARCTAGVPSCVGRAWCGGAVNHRRIPPSQACAEPRYSERRVGHYAAMPPPSARGS
jgi:hypothetical protein